MAKHDAVYDADLHTKAKHAILREYLRRWLPILQRQSKNNLGGRRLLYIDGFAGAGRYLRDVPGSPVVALDVMRQQGADDPVPVEVMLIEKDAERARILAETVAGIRATLPGNTSIRVKNPVQGDCEEELEALLDQHSHQKLPLGPAFVFLDQFGYGEFSIQLIARILQHSSCETLSFLNWRMMHPWFSDPTKANPLNKAFGGNEWKSAAPLALGERSTFIRDLYKRMLQTRGGAKYVYPFTMRGRDDQIAYWLFFSTNNIRGLEEMKRAMWQVDESGGFTFSDRDGETPAMFHYDDDALARDLQQVLGGRKLTLAELNEHVLVETPAYKWKAAAASLEKRSLLTVVDCPPGRRSGSFNDPSLVIEIHVNPVGQGSFW